jgi:hypothetical protein
VCCRSCLLQPDCCEGFPLPPLRRPEHPTLFATYLFCCYCLLFSFFFFFFPWVGVGLSRGQRWPRIVCGSTACSLAPLVVVSSQAAWTLASPGGTWTLLVSPFNMKWRCYVQAASVEESKFCPSR